MPVVTTVGAASASTEGGGVARMLSGLNVAQVLTITNKVPQKLPDNCFREQEVLRLRGTRAV